LRYQALRGVLAFKADTDPAAAIQLAQKLGEFRGHEPLSNAIYRQWAANDAQAAAVRGATSAIRRMVAVARSSGHEHLVAAGSGRGR
jgi:hypothetical protein